MILGYLQEKKDSFNKEVRTPLSEKMEVSPFIVSRQQVQAKLFSLQLCCKGCSGSSVMHGPSLAASDGVNYTPVKQRHCSCEKEQLCFSLPFRGLECVLWRSSWVVAVAWLWFLGVIMSGITVLCRMTVTLVQSFHIGPKEEGFKQLERLSYLWLVQQATATGGLHDSKHKCISFMLTILISKLKNGQDCKVRFRGKGWIFYQTKSQLIRSVLATLSDLLLYVPVP